MSSGVLASPLSQPRPTPLVWAVGLSALVALSGLLAMATPWGNEAIPAEAIVLSVVLGVAALGACWFTWQYRRWAAIVLTVVNGLQVIGSVPPLIDGVNAFIVTLTVIALPLTVAAMVLTWRPASRRVYR